MTRSTSRRSINARLSNYTAWRTLDALKSALAAGLRPPSFCILKPWARKLADDLEMLGLPVLRYT